jgi:hypothetical protein
MRAVLVLPSLNSRQFLAARLCYIERKRFLSEKSFFFHRNVFGKMTLFCENVFRKYFFHGFAHFSISENIQKFTLFRKVLFPLNEKYSGLLVCYLHSGFSPCCHVTRCFSETFNPVTLRFSIPTLHRTQ